MKNLIKLLTGALISLIAIIGMMILTVSCDTDKSRCGEGGTYASWTKDQMACRLACENRGLTRHFTWDREEGHCCCW